MKVKKTYLLYLFSSLLLFSCNDEGSDKIGGDGETKNEKAYFSLNLFFPETVSTRSTTSNEDGDGYQEGLATEQKFQNVVVALVNSSNVVVESLNYTSTDFAPHGNSAADDNTINPSQPGATKTYSLIDPSLVTMGSYYVYVFLNPTTAITSALATGATVNHTLKTEITPLTSADITGSYALDNNFLMGNADTIRLYSVSGTLANPTVVNISVERFVTKLVENTTTQSFNVQNTKGATSVTATFVDYNYNFLNKRAFYLKQVEQRSDAGSIAGAYVVDPNFTSADYLAFNPASPWYGNDLFVIGNQGITQTFTTTPEIYYCLENTMISNEQYSNKTTSIVYKADLSIDGNASTTIFTYRDIIYASYNDLATAYNADNPGTPNALQNLFTMTDVTNAYSGTGTTYTANVLALNTLLHSEGIRCFYNGECYYNWPIKHWEQSVLLGRMEFALVRNNVYYLTIQSVANIGEPWVPGGPEDPNPPTPDETEDVYLSVDIAVLPWVVRSNDIVF